MMSLALVMCLTLCIPAFAVTQEETLKAQSVIAQVSNDNEENLSIKAIQPLYNFGGEQIATMYYFLPNGYAIYDDASGIVLECSEEDNPYFTDPTATYYFDGVLNYYVKEGSNFIELSSGKTYSEDDVNTDTKISDLTDDSNLLASTRSTVAESRNLNYPTRLYNCNVSQNFSYYGIPSGSAGVCGSTALAILSAYYDDYYPSTAGSGDWADNTEKSSGTGSTYGRDLVRDIVAFVEPRTGDASSLTGFNNYLSSRSIPYSISVTYFNAYNTVKSLINNDRISVVGIFATSYGDHWVCAIGYRTIDSVQQIRINDGRGRTSVYVSVVNCASTWKINF